MVIININFEVCDDHLQKFPGAPLPMAYKREAPPTLGKGLTVQMYV
nr:MAG TPA: hypothetical protein [Bacteriophage sp.]